ncbi:isochorismatase family protein [Nitratireductor mangrovi]|uniref:isochorismatase family protein n=1 Tax=Nitratireductor mangrovi TaxID=2599600 RepID=UPI00198088CA|nr:cysteine hydrolase [Nitratireductor mangrovi]
MISQHIIDRVIARRGRLHLFDTLEAKRTALVVIDMQKTFCEPGAPAEVPASRTIIGAINRLAAGLRKAGGKIIWCTHANVGVDDSSDWRNFFDHFVADDIRSSTIESLSPDGSGQDIWHELQTSDEDIKLLKNRYSALIPGSSQLERILRSLDIDTLLICGTKTNICCESTARDAMMLDFKVVMVSDGTAALSEEEHRAALENVIQQFGDVMSADEILQRI